MEIRTFTFETDSSMIAPIKNDILKYLEGFAKEQLTLLRPVNDCWQPSDFLPDMADKGWYEKVVDLRKKTAGLSDEVLVILVGNIVTEEALPAYMSWLNRLNGLKDETGASSNPWALWVRGWTAEENRHGELLNKYLYLSGRVNMRSFELTTHYLIKNGFDLKSGNDPYRSIIYGSFQERATKISHANTGKLAEKCGDPTLGKICSAIAGDEARHEEAYKRFFHMIVEIDAPNAVIAFAEMMKQKIDMPARLMSDGTSRNLFNQFAVAAQRAGVYTFRDYAEIIRHLVDYWEIASIANLSNEAAQSQDYLCGLYDDYSTKANRLEKVIQRLPKEPFEWIFGRSA